MSTEDVKKALSIIKDIKKSDIIKASFKKDYDTAKSGDSRDGCYAVVLEFHLKYVTYLIAFSIYEEENNCVYSEEKSLSYHKNNLYVENKTYVLPNDAVKEDEDEDDFLLDVYPTEYIGKYPNDVLVTEKIDMSVSNLDDYDTRVVYVFIDELINKLGLNKVFPISLVDKKEDDKVKNL